MVVNEYEPPLLTRANNHLAPSFLEIARGYQRSTIILVSCEVFFGAPPRSEVHAPFNAFRTCLHNKSAANAPVMCPFSMTEMRVEP